MGEGGERGVTPDSSCSRPHRLGRGKKKTTAGLGSSPVPGKTSGRAPSKRGGGCFFRVFVSARWKRMNRDSSRKAGGNLTDFLRKTQAVTKKREDHDAMRHGPPFSSGPKGPGGMDWPEGLDLELSGQVEQASEGHLAKLCGVGVVAAFELCGDDFLDQVGL